MHINFYFTMISHFSTLMTFSTLINFSTLISHFLYRDEIFYLDVTLLHLDDIFYLDITFLYLDEIFYLDITFTLPWWHFLPRDTTVFKGERFNKEAIFDIRTISKPAETLPNALADTHQGSEKEFHQKYFIKKSYILNLAGFRGLRTSPLTTMTMYSYPRSTPSI